MEIFQCIRMVTQVSGKSQVGGHGPSRAASEDAADVSNGNGAKVRSLMLYTPESKKGLAEILSGGLSMYGVLLSLAK
jgi:hypothetical protein